MGGIHGEVIELSRRNKYIANSISLWVLPIFLSFVYTVLHYKTLDFSSIRFFEPFEGIYLVYFVGS